MSADLAGMLWPVDRAGEVIEALAAAARLEMRAVDTPRFPGGFDTAREEALEVWMEQSAKWLGLEIEGTACPYPDVEVMLRGAGPAIVRVEHGGGIHLLALLETRRRSLAVLAPDLRVRRLDVGAARSLVCRKAESTAAAEVDRVLDRAKLRAGRRERARRELLRELLRGHQVSGCWMLRMPPESSFGKQLRRAEMVRRLALLLGVHALQYGLWIASWWAIGRGALRGQIDIGWLAAWVILLLSLVPLRMLTTWWAGRIAVDAGALIKQRLMAGAVRCDPDELRHEGVGQLLGRVLESEAVEAMALSGGFLTLLAGVELLMAMVVLGAGVGGALHVVLLVGWTGLAVALARGYLRRRGAWTERRLRMTHGLVERMVGHATRLAQQRPEHWHDGEDDELARYVEDSRRMDRSMVLMTALVPHGWLLVGMLGVVPAFVTSAVATTPMAIALGGVLLAYRAFRQMVEGLAYLGGAAISWRQVAPVFEAAKRTEAVGPPALAIEPEPGDDTPAIAVQDLVFRHRQREEAVLRGCELEVREGEKILLEGPSGSGKSTLGALLSGVRQPDGGLLLVGGLDHHTLGAEGWRSRLACAPQFHENFVFGGTLAFNLLMGRRWPPPERDLGEAEALCRDLGLGDVIDRMPGGMLQLVGETGWQLSHGERSRVYIARALLQRSRVVLLDESFAGLDPATQEQALRCVLDRARTLLVIAHP